MQTRAQFIRRWIVLFAVTMLVLLPMLLFWDTSGNAAGRIVISGLAVLLGAGFIAVSVTEMVRQRRH